MGANSYWAIKREPVGANEKGRYIWNQHGLLYMTTKSHQLAPPLRVTLLCKRKDL